jgi:hypothetical protein
MLLLAAAAAAVLPQMLQSYTQDTPSAAHISPAAAAAAADRHICQPCRCSHSRLLLAMRCTDAPHLSTHSM